MHPEVQLKILEELSRKVDVLLLISGGDIPLKEYCRRFKKSKSTAYREISKYPGMSYKNESGKHMIRLSWLIEKRNGNS